MPRQSIPLSFAIAILLSVGVVSATDKPMPPFSDVEAAVLRYFRALPNYRSGDLITRGEVKPLWGQLQKLGFSPSDAEQIIGDIPAKNEFLPTQLRTRAGKKFMRQIAKYPDAYDRLDRLSRMPHGRQTIRDLMKGPGGEKMIEYMPTTSGGKELGKLLSNNPRTRNFNKPTGRIYTAAMLIARLEESHTAAVKASTLTRSSD